MVLDAFKVNISRSNTLATETLVKISSNLGADYMAGVVPDSRAGLFPKLCFLCDYMAIQQPDEVEVNAGNFGTITIRVSR